MTSSAGPSSARRVIQLPLEPGLICLKGLSPTRLRFEVEYGLERGTTANSFLFTAAVLLVHPPGASFAEPFLAELATLVPAEAPLKVVVGDVNPNRVALLRQLAARWPNLLLVSSNAGARLLEDLWNLQKPIAPDSEAPPGANPTAASDRCGEAGGQPQARRWPRAAADSHPHPPLARRADGL